MTEAEGERRAILLRVIVLCIGLACALLGGEIAVRVLKRDVAFQPDPDLFRSLRPHVEREVYGYDTPEVLESHVLPDARVFLGMDYTNNLGLRMRDDVVEKRPGEKRTLLFGDSYTEATGFPDDQRFYQVMQRVLDARGGDGARWRVVNAGIQNGAPSQYVLMARRLLPRVEPDVVILVLGGNDLADDLNFERRHGYEFDENGIPVRLERRLQLRLLQSSWLLRYLYVVVEQLSVRLNLDLSSAPADPSVELIPWQALYCAVAPASQRAFRDKTGRYIGELARLSREAGARFGVFLIHYVWSFENESFYYERFGDAFRTALAEWGCDSRDIGPYRRLMKTYFDEIGVPSYDSYERMIREKRERPERKLWGYYDHHFSPAGHQVIGEDLAVFLDALKRRAAPAGVDTGSAP